MLWQESVYNVTDRLIFGSLKYFYLLSTGDAGSNSIAYSNVSGFFQNGNNINNNKSSNNKHSGNDMIDNGDNISCILVGVTGPFLRRLHALQVEPLMMTDKETLKAVDFRKVNLDKQMQGCVGIVT